jgi:hypothetical protein
MLYLNQNIARTGDASPDEQQMLFWYDFHNLKILHCHPSVAHTSRHALALPDTAWCRTAPNGAGCSQAITLPVCARSPTKPVAFDHTGKPATFRCANHINPLTNLEHLDI